jgi:predicted nuclease of predicted toxin-antitoxin system
MTFLVDYNLDGYALIFLGILAKRGWLEFQSVQFVTFREAELSMESSDRVVWRYAQEHQMMIFTANRNMKGEDSLFAGYARREYRELVSSVDDWEFRSFE